MTAYFDTSVVTKWYLPEPDSADALGAHSLDILHVATALVCQATAFVTNDDRQARLARAAGLRVTTLRARATQR